MERKKLCVIGIDGGDMEAIRHYFDKLPNLAQLINQGASTTLLSTTPPHTSLGWVSMTTGVKPGRHGVFQFWETKSRNYQPDFSTSKTIHVPFLWEWLSNQGFKVNVINVPMTHPPRPVNGCLITWPLTNTLRFSFPPNLLTEISRDVGPYLSDLATMYKGEPDYIKKAEQYIERKTETMIHLLKHYAGDFSMVVFTEVDRVSHYDFAGFGTDLEKAYIRIDEAIGRIRRELPEETVFAVVSDHGFTEGKWDFYVHGWLEERGLLHYKDTASDNSWYLKEVDMRQTICYMPAPGSYALNINLKGRETLGIVEPSEFSSICERLREELQEVLTPDGKPMFQDVKLGSEVYAGECVEKAPDLVMIPYDYGNMVQHIRPIKKVFEKSSQKGLHRREGIFLLDAQGVMAGSYKTIMEIEDVFPTILYAAGYPIPEYLDGEIRAEFFDSTWIETHRPLKLGENGVTAKEVPVTNDGYSEEEKTLIEQRLRDMGYL
ncbi:alkaline phosphatase family protein [Bacillus cereus]|uniref:alkaline phosphatase family protein n=1 Tax=Bacillus cereus TaxID=1396 RepID=UPI00065B933B|nr:alkaline phosphatase family protein [Bacillus cereus]KMQ32174.1 hypothetical protein TU58_01420 [Bacillus cereus]